MRQIALRVPLFYPRTVGVATDVPNLFLVKPERRCRRKAGNCAGRVCDGGKICRLRRGDGRRVTEESKLNDVAKNAGRYIMQSREGI